MDNSLDRLLQAIEYLKGKGKIHKQQDIAETLSMNKVNVSRAIKGTPRYFTEGFLKRFGQAYKDYIFEEWLLTGKGDMAKPEKETRPHFEARVSAGFLSGFSDQIMKSEFRNLIEQLPEYDFTIDIEGDSMSPEILDGDTICCRIANDRQNPPIGRICVLDTKNGPVVKVIKSVTEDSLILHSFNQKYPDYSLEFTDINNIALVVGVIRIIHS